MAKTPDRRPGPSYEEKLILQNEGLTADAQGEMVYNGTSFSFRDSVGAFDPRSGGGGITEGQHKALRDLIHFLDDGPGDGFASGAYKETLPSADPFPTSEIWWTSAAKTHKILELTITRNANKTPATEVWRMYDSDGSTVLITLTDTIVYSGIFETTRTRTWS